MIEGTRVVDLGTMITGPLAAMLLANLGAEVVKVEAPAGDPFRSFAPDGYGPQFSAYNAGKLGVTLDLQTQAGREALRNLLGSADVLIENYRPGTMARFGFGDLAHEFPRLVHCSITGFGADGPYSDRPAYDGVAQSFAGLAALLLDPEAPQASGPTIADNVTGYTAALAVLGALLERSRTGTGRHVEVNMLEATIAFMPDVFAMEAMTGRSPNNLSRVAGSQTFVLRCGDGELVTLHLSVPEKFWRGLVLATGAAELASDERFAARPARVANYAALRAELQKVFSSRPRAEWLARLTEHDVPHAPVLSVAAVPDDPQVRHLELFGASSHPSGNVLRHIRAPWRVDGTRPAAVGRAPTLGEHNAASPGHSPQR